MKIENLDMVRSSNIEVGQSYVVRVHGHDPIVMKCTRKPSRNLANMTPRDAFVFETNDLKIRFKTHGTGGPQFLVTKVAGKRGGKVNARVTFYSVPKRGRKTKKVEKPVAPVIEQVAA